MVWVPPDDMEDVTEADAEQALRPAEAQPTEPVVLVQLQLHEPVLRPLGQPVAGEVVIIAWVPPSRERLVRGHPLEIRQLAQYA